MSAIKQDPQLLQLLSNLLLQVESITDEEECELRSKIEALGSEVTKVPSKSRTGIDELEIARELDDLSAKLEIFDAMISSAIDTDPQVQELLAGTADLWMPLITANADERLQFSESVEGEDDRAIVGEEVRH